MKKPVKLTGAALQEVIAKRKTKFITVEKHVPSGSVANIISAANKFAADNGVDVSDVKFVNSNYYGYGGKFHVRREETEAEKAKRVKDEEAYKFRNKEYEYKVWLREQEDLRRQAEAINARLAANNRVASNSKCCPSDCCCRRK